MSADRSPNNLIWIDLEFTNLDPASGYIMQAAMIVTAPDLTPLPPPGASTEAGGLLFDLKLDATQVATASDWVRANQAEQLVRSQGEAAVSLEDAQEQFVAYLLHTCEVPDDKRERPLLAGNSVHGDQRFILHHMPELERLLSFRLLDVTSFKEVARRWCPRYEFNKNRETIRRWFPGPITLKGDAHDALYDIKASIAELNFYRSHLFIQEARGPAPGTSPATSPGGPSEEPLQG